MTQSTIHPVTIRDAAKILLSGDVCAFATETVYGLGGDATNSDAVLAIYATKARPRFNPLIVHCCDMEMARELVVFSDMAEKLAEAFWPGPLTLVLPLKEGAEVSELVTAGLDTLAVRVPALESARDLIRAVGRPIAAPSANPSGRLSATTAEQVHELFENKVPVLDGGACTAGVESTIISVSDESCVQLRAGALPRDEISTIIGFEVVEADVNAAISAPGMLKSHYAPNAKMRLNIEMPDQGEAYLAFGPFAGNNDNSTITLNLSEAGDLKEAARNLFAHLHRLDAENPQRIAVAPIPQRGLGEAINDRLARAAAPRP